MTRKSRRELERAIAELEAGGRDGVDEIVIDFTGVDT